MIQSPQGWYQRLKADPRAAAFSPQLSAAVIFRNGKSEVPATLIGCDPLQQQKVTSLAQYVVEGKFADLAGGGNRLVLGHELQQKLGIGLTQNVMVSLANGEPVPFKVVAVFKTGMKQVDTQAYGALGDVQAVSATPNEVNAIAVKLHDHTGAAALATTWSQIGPEKVESWDQINANIFNIFRVQDAIRFLSIGSILIVAGFGIYNVLNMTVMQKHRDIAILRSMGYDTGEVTGLFFSQGLILGLMGAVLGLFLVTASAGILKLCPFREGRWVRGRGILSLPWTCASTRRRPCWPWPPLRWRVFCPRIRPGK